MVLAAVACVTQACGSGSSAPLSTHADASAAGDAGKTSSGSAAADAAVACSVVAPTSCPTPAPAYADVSPIFAARCASCHSGAAGGPWPLDSYSTISDWRNEIRASLVDCSMPPADAGSALTDAERDTLVGWMNCGAPR